MAANQPQQLLAWPLVSPITIAPGPVPTEFALGEAKFGNEVVIVLQAVTPAGVTTLFVPKASAVELGKKLQSMGGAGLVVAPAGILPR